MEGLVPKMKNNKKDEYYWAERKKNIDCFWGKGKLINEVSELVGKQQCSLLELGCGEGHILGELAKKNPDSQYFGVDYDEKAIEHATRLYPDVVFIHDSIQNFLIENKKTFDFIIAANVFHELYSDAVRKNCNEAKTDLEQIFNDTISLLNANGLFILLDGLENDNKDLNYRFSINDHAILSKYNEFIESYSFLDCSYAHADIGEEICMNCHDFTRFITKLRFVGEKNWNIEKNETYQYFTEAEFLEMFKNNKLHILKRECFIADIRKWKQSIILQQGDYPYEHIILMGMK